MLTVWLPNVSWRLCTSSTVSSEPARNRTLYSLSLATSVLCVTPSLKLDRVCLHEPTTSKLQLLLTSIGCSCSGSTCPHTLLVICVASHGTCSLQRLTQVPCISGTTETRSSKCSFTTEWSIHVMRFVC